MKSGHWLANIAASARSACLRICEPPLDCQMTDESRNGFDPLNRPFLVVVQINYHLKMMSALVPWIVQLNVDGPQILRNACLESFLTHVRLLIEFANGRPHSSSGLNRKRNSRDETPSVFGLQDWTTSPPLLFDEYLKKIDARMAHLSSARIDDLNGSQWAVEAMASGLLTAYANLVDAIERTGQTESARLLRRGIEQSLELLASPPIAWRSA
jgi:hypothetical protein